MLVPCIVDGLAGLGLIRRLDFRDCVELASWYWEMGDGELTNITDDAAEERCGREFEIWPLCSDVDIQISNGGTSKPWQVLLHPLCAADQPILLAIPAGKHNRPKWLPPSLKRYTKAPNHLVQSRRATVRIASTACNPCVAVVAKHNDLVRNRSIDDSNDIPQWGGDVLLLIYKI
jgi:hypothetical protein